jgi:hypothetical protein
MRKDDLLPGDILLLKDEPSKDFNVKHIGIRIGQAFTSLYRANYGGSCLVHAVLWVRSDLTDPEIAEASGSCAQVQARNLQPGLYVIFRPRDKRLGQEAANMAKYLAHLGYIGYSKSGAVQSVFHSSRLGRKGKERAKEYAAGDFTTQAPFQGAAFCSEFVLACYQGAAGGLGLALTGALKADAKHCSVRALNDLLIRDGETFVWKGNVVE